MQGWFESTPASSTCFEEEGVDFFFSCRWVDGVSNMEERGKCVVCIGEKSCDSLLKLQRLFRRGEGGGGGSAKSRFLSHVGGGGTFSNPFSFDVLVTMGHVEERGGRRVGCKRECDESFK